MNKRKERKLINVVSKEIEIDSEYFLGLLNQLESILEHDLVFYFFKMYDSWYKQASCIEVAINELKDNLDDSVGDIPVEGSPQEDFLLDYAKETKIGRDSIVRAIWRTMKTKILSMNTDTFQVFDRVDDPKFGEKDYIYSIRCPVCEERLYERYEIPHLRNEHAYEYRFDDRHYNCFVAIDYPNCSTGWFDSSDYDFDYCSNIFTSQRDFVANCELLETFYDNSESTYSEDYTFFYYFDFDRVEVQAKFNLYKARSKYRFYNEYDFLDDLYLSHVMREYERSLSFFKKLQFKIIKRMRKFTLSSFYNYIEEVLE